MKRFALHRQRGNNPYPILFFAVPFLVGGMMLLLRTEPMTVMAHAARGAPGSYVGKMSPEMEHFFGAMGVLIGANIVGFYAYLRREIGMGLNRPGEEEEEEGNGGF